MPGMQSVLRTCAAVLAAGAPAAALQAASAEEWPMFRGDAAHTGVAKSPLPAAPRIAWTFDAGKGIVSSPVVGGGRVYFGCDDSKLYALDARSGELAWSYATGDVIEAPPLLAGGKVYVGSSDGWFYALDAASGELAWKAE